MSRLEHGRNRDLERAFLRAAGADDDYCDAAQARLDQHGHTIAERGPAELVQELAEELLDAGAWSWVLAVNAPDLTPKQAALLETIVTHAHTTWRLTRELAVSLPTAPRSAPESFSHSRERAGG